MHKYNRDILFHIETEAQFDSLMPLLVHLRDSTKVTFDIVVPNATSKETAPNKDVYEGGVKALVNNGFVVIRSVDGVSLPDDIINTRYQVLLSAYMYHEHYQKLNVKYRIMFPYASYYFNKPNWTIERFINQDYLAHALLSHAIGTKDVTDIFTKTHLVPSLKLMNFEKKPRGKGKPTLFFAPTYNEIGFAVSFLQNIDTIKKEYTVIMRGHHKTSHIQNNKDINNKLYQNADKVYDVDDYSIVTPLEEADIVVSDNSAVIFDAIYCGVPVALFSQDPNSFRFREVNTLQSELIKKGDILWTNSPKKIINIVNKTMAASMLKKQEKMRYELFPMDTIDPVRRWMDVLSVYLEDRLPGEYAFIKQYWIEKINHPVEENQVMRTEIENLNLQIKNRDTSIFNEQHPGVKTATRRFVKACLYKMNYLKRGI